jgi:hypothetical protein
VKVDRYTKVVLTVIAVALSTLAFKDIVAPQPAVAAAPALGEGRYQLVDLLLENGVRGMVIDTRSGSLYWVPRLRMGLPSLTSIADLTQSGYVQRPRYE